MSLSKQEQSEVLKQFGFGLVLQQQIAKFGCLNWGSNFVVLVNGRSIPVHHFNDASVEIFTKYETFQSHDDEK